MQQQHKVVCFGEVLWDVYPNEKKLGGAPFNVAAHLQQLGTTAHIITKIGIDTLGHEIKQAIQAQNISINQLQLAENLPTGTVKINLDINGIPQYKINEPAAWDFIQADLTNQNLVKDEDALVYGTLACRSAQNFETLIGLAKLSKLNICDLNIRQNFYSKALIESLLKVTHILKINDEEEKLLIEMFQFKAVNLYEQIESNFNLKIIIKTKGEKGAEAYQNGIIFSTDGVKVKVVDTVGSGDAFLAAFIHNHLKAKDIQYCLNEGVKLGAFVATKLGAIPKHLT